MESVIRGIVVYAFLLVIFRVAGNRTLAQTTSFDFVLLLIISETTQQAMVDTDHSITNAFLLIITLVGVSIFMSVLKIRFPRVEKWIDGLPVIVLEHGKLMHDRMKKIRIDESDILSSARMYHGLERLDQIKYAIVEHSGEITIVPKEK
jgi:uncharacterized membrane protein YcaP (DUF421 family)